MKGGKKRKKLVKGLSKKTGKKVQGGEEEVKGENTRLECVQQGNAL